MWVVGVAGAERKCVEKVWGEPGKWEVKSMDGEVDHLEAARLFGLDKVAH